MQIANERLKSCVKFFITYVLVLFSDSLWALGASIPDSSGKFTVSWSDPGSQNGYTQLFEKIGTGAWGINPVVTYSYDAYSIQLTRNPGTYSYYLKMCYYMSSYPTCSSSNTVTVVVAAPPSASSGSSFDLDFESGLGLWVNTGYKWYVRSGSTPSSNTGPIFADQGGFYAFMEASSGDAFNAGNTAILQSPTIDMSGMDITFLYHAYGTHIGSLYLELSNGSSWITLWSFSGQQSSSSDQEWHRIVVPMTGYSGNRKVRFRAVAVGGDRGDIAVDDISLIRRKTSNSVNTDFVYDELGRLTFVKNSAIGNRDYDYDKAGNRTSVTANSASD